MKKLLNIRYVSFLLIATFAVAAPRYMGVFGQIVGEDLVKIWPLFKLVEIWSGLAMGALEALVLEYIIQRVKRIEQGSLYWWASLGAACFILITFPIVTAPYMVAMMNDVLIRDILSGTTRVTPAFWGWTFLVASLIPLIVAAIGIVRDDGPEGQGREENYYTNDRGLQIPVEVQGHVFLDNWFDEHKKEPIVPEFMHYFGEITGHQLTEEEADQWILDWRRSRGRVGARPSTPSLPLPEVGQNGHV